MSSFLKSSKFRSWTGAGGWKMNINHKNECIDVIHCGENEPGKNNLNSSDTFFSIDSVRLNLVLGRVWVQSSGQLLCNQIVCTKKLRMWERLMVFQFYQKLMFSNAVEVSREVVEGIPHDRRYLTDQNITDMKEFIFANHHDNVSDIAEEFYTFHEHNFILRQVVS